MEVSGEVMLRPLCYWRRILRYPLDRRLRGLELV
jgi:hypothetical protein